MCSDASVTAYRAAFGPDGYLVREAVLDRAECARLHEAVESVSETVTAHAERPGAGPSAHLADGHRIQLSARTAIQWEWRDGSRAIRLLEPCDHLHPVLDALFADPRLTAPVAAELGAAPAPFTSKLNFKRAVEGSEFPWHQDFPYWYTAIGDAAQDVVTAIVFLDDATAANGALPRDPGLPPRRSGAPRPGRPDAVPDRCRRDRHRRRGDPRGPGRERRLVRRVPRALLGPEPDRAAPPRPPAVLATGRPGAAPDVPVRLHARRGAAVTPGIGTARPSTFPP